MLARIFSIAAACVLALCFLTPAHAAPSGNSPYRSHIDLGGAWDFHAVPSTAVDAKTPLPEFAQWDSIHVPDNWYLQGKDISGQAWYRKRFDIEPERAGRHARLLFEGVDYKADVWLNGQYLGHHEGYFQPFDFDISQQLHAGRNTLWVLVDSPLEKPEDWSLNKRLIKGVLSHHDTRPGGAWSARGQEMNTGGIWAPVSIEITNQLAIRRLEVVPQKQGQDWQVQSSIALASDLPAGSTVSVDGTITPENFSGSAYTFTVQRKLASGNSDISVSNIVSQPELWWPAGHGQPNLYRMQLAIRYQDRVLAQREAVFGFREITADPITLQWQVNGRRLFIRGTNYISTQWLAEMTPQRYARDIDLMQQAHINAIRVHAHIEAQSFYDACDRKGMLVMQDFPLQWGYSDDAVFVADARRQAADMVYMLNNHAAIASWTLHNEPPWDAPWMKDKYPNYRPQQNHALDDQLFADVSALEKHRVVRKLSATQEHVWLGWYFDDWHAYGGKTGVPWITEYGAQALPDLASLKRIFTEQELWPDNEQEWAKWSFHNFQRNETFNIAKVPMGANIDEFIRNSQAHQAEVIQLAAENYRRQRYAPVAAIFQFMFNEDWPSISWGVVDYWRQPKAGYEALKMAYQPVLPSIEWKKNAYAPGESAVLGLWLINDTWENLSQLRYSVSASRDGEQFYSKTLPAEVTADGDVKINELKLDHMEPGEYVVVAKVARSDGSVLGANRYTFSVR
ncbi:MAG TPA: glycoside hydrolase family 2 TIM barrel-domain containing protein [Methylophilaceae bacterium]|nr:glycoside hydrolase family 2 TIM barrel-domain containing protein [Methylophilaceae bacterium]